MKNKITKEICITRLTEGTFFKYKDETFQVVDRSEYPFIEAKCLSTPNDYEGLNLLFTNFEMVNVLEEPF